MLNFSIHSSKASVDVPLITSRNDWLASLSPFRMEDLPPGTLEKGKALQQMLAGSFLLIPARVQDVLDGAVKLRVTSAGGKFCVIQRAVNVGLNANSFYGSPFLVGADVQF